MKPDLFDRRKVSQPWSIFRWKRMTFRNADTLNGTPQPMRRKATGDKRNGKSQLADHGAERQQSRLHILTRTPEANRKMRTLRTRAGMQRNRKEQRAQRIHEHLRNHRWILLAQAHLHRVRKIANAPGRVHEGLEQFKEVQGDWQLMDG